MLEVEFHEEAQEELSIAAGYYESCEAGLGEAFLQSIEAGLTKIRERPSSWGLLFDDIHRFLIVRFPYDLVYRIEADRIYILAVMHQRRRPGYWLARR